MKSISYHVIPLDINSLRDRYTRTHTNTYKQMHITHTNIQVHSHVHKHTHTHISTSDYKNQTCTSQIATARQSVRKTDNYLMCALALTLKQQYTGLRHQCLLNQINYKSYMLLNLLKSELCLNLLLNNWQQTE